MAQNGQHARLEIDTTGPLGTYGQHGRVQLLITAVNGQHARVELTSVSVPVRSQHARVELAAPTAFPLSTYHARVELTGATPVKAGADQVNIEPGQLVTITGAAGDGIGDPLWVQVSGPSVTLTQVGVSATFRAPATLAGATLTFRYSVDGAIDDMFVTVLPALEQMFNGVQMVPQVSYPTAVLQ